MSDPMTNTEVEDVLSSIRRLVSDEKTPVPVTKPSENKLVLTPSLRVMDDPAEQNALSNDYVDTDAGAQEETKGETAQPGSRVAAPQENITDTEEPGGRVDLSDPENPANAQGPNPENSEHRGEQIVGTATPPSDSIAEKIAILEKLIAARADQWEPDEAGTDPYAGTQAPALVGKRPKNQKITPRIRMHLQISGPIRRPPTLKLTSKSQSMLTAMMCWMRKPCADLSARLCARSCKVNLANGSRETCASWCAGKSTAH